MIKALQIIALKQGAIDDAFVATALHELGGGVPCVSVSVSAKDSYVVEKKTMATKGEILIYRKKETGHVRGVVFTFS
jgi:ammonia channel protein AmtB